MTPGELLVRASSSRCYSFSRTTTSASPSPSTILLVVVLLLVSPWGIHSASYGSNSDSDSDSSERSTAGGVGVGGVDWIAQCRSFGFDVTQLACSTCAVLPTLFHDECRRCCQVWLDTPRMAKPYEAALLLDRRGITSSGGAFVNAPNDELQQFLDQDWTAVEGAVNGNNKSSSSPPRLSRIEHSPTTSSSGSGSSASRSFLTMYQPSVILFFNVPLPPLTALSSSKRNQQRDAEMDAVIATAAETVSLEGMKRDDIKNMLLALLPSKSDDTRDT